MRLSNCSKLKKTKQMSYDDKMKRDPGLDPLAIKDIIGTTGKTQMRSDG